MEVRSWIEVDPLQAKDNSVVREIFHPKNSNVKNPSLAKAKIKVGKRTRKHYHEKSEEIYFILEGKDRVHVEGKAAKVEKGDAVLIPPGHSHWMENLGSKRGLELLCFSSPPYGKEDTILEAERKVIS